MVEQKSEVSGDLRRRDTNCNVTEMKLCRGLMLIDGKVRSMS